jgi:hypothetical protein
VPTIYFENSRLEYSKSILPKIFSVVPMGRLGEPPGQRFYGKPKIIKGDFPLEKPLRFFVPIKNQVAYLP